LNICLVFPRDNQATPGGSEDEDTKKREGEQMEK
jgi:hypothetical protein